MDKYNDFKNKMEQIQCKECFFWSEPHVKMNDGTERAYTPDDIDGLGLQLVTCDVGINIGGQCYENPNIPIFRNENDYCSRARLIN